MTEYINNRELSWLSFNERVLMEALDRGNPLLERLKFIAISASNLDEFFMVRVSGLREQLHVGYDEPDESGLSPKEQLEMIYNRTNKFYNQQQKIFSELKEELAKESIFFPNPADLAFVDLLEGVFLDEIMPVISPVTLTPSHPFPFIYSRRMCILVHMKRRKEDFLSLITLPETLRRVYKIRKGKSVNIFTAEDIIKLHLPMLYKGYEIINTGTFRVTRDADLDVSAEESADLLKTVEHLLSQRKRGEVSRLEVNHDISENALSFLMKVMGVAKEDISFVNGTIDLTFLFNLADMKESLMFQPLVQRPVQGYKPGANIFDQIKKKPFLLFRPYNSFNFVAELISKAAKDPNVLAIKMTLYRTNKNSKIVGALLEAAKRGKQVSVVVELKARFDEETNIEWAKNLEEAGCIVTYGLVGLKIHAKSMLIVRREDDKIMRYTHVSTGNYNESTACVYTDIDIISADEDLGRDATQLFNYLMGFTEEEKWLRLKVAPFNLRQEIVDRIDQEIAFAKKTNGHIIMKMNSLTDKEIIQKLYEASGAGVKVELIVRGICALMPGIKGVSENIHVRSIVGRFLEHSRVFYFRHGGENVYYISSADMMPRNLNGRVETMMSIRHDEIKASLKHYLDVQLRDNCKAWVLKETKYTKLTPGGDEEISSQDYFLKNEI